MWQLPTQIAKGNWNYFKLSEFRVIGVKITVKVLGKSRGNQFCLFNFEGKKKHVIVLKNELGKIDK